ncbi:Rho/RAC guanine nucleotide exchange factor, putative [Entamoeba invadens IP1]|uniref:Rho/RAC guanine nucleotide exchange factor, putative n=1 Tax=Entamoeba invadens IP1 TaxID=370355 RepID=UPI0002C3E90E|nr:Rho/RAC guanine nucleotide exchange factor, putative [Entamoeba invadens IP1]ELP93399.1 Rho/RAC guanine nucleotide exchange factor, putative [Entamoeba invadens IP1]|eukprot:XP_004260170.1 Rho/RAC guanine nucleotide exchange factor, putative [Entamoeba invadens IP1]
MRCSTITDPKESNHRKHIVDEIFSTEVSYVKSLEDCITYFQKPLMEENPPTIVGGDVMILFLHFQQIISVNSVLVEKLKEVQTRGTLYTNLGGAFIKFIPFLKSYTQFASNQDNCLQVLKKLEQDKIVVQHLEDLRQKIKASNQLDLRSYLIMPIQRLPRYVLLFTDLMKHTPENFPDFTRLKKVLEEIQKVAILVNQCMVQGEKLRRLVEISQQVDFPGGDLTIGRKLVRDGILSKQCRKAPKPRYFVLCTDLLFYTAPKKREVEFVLSLFETDIRDGQGMQFDIFSPTRSFTVFAKDDAEKAEWLKDLTTTIDNCKKNSVLLKQANISDKGGDKKIAAMKPVFVPDDQAKECMRCHKDFGVMRRRHHCRFCGGCVCDSCSKNRLKTSGTTLERACDDCFNRLVCDPKALSELVAAMGDSDDMKTPRLSPRPAKTDKKKKKGTGSPDVEEGSSSEKIAEEEKKEEAAKVEKPAVNVKNLRAMFEQK